MKTLRQLFPEAYTKNISEILYEPADKDSRRLFNFKNRFTVDDGERHNKSGTLERDSEAVDRAGNKRYVFSGSTSTYPRSTNRMGYVTGRDAAVYDLGKDTAPINRQNRAGLRQTALPIVTVKEGLTTAELAEGEFVVEAVAYLRGIEDEAERNEAAEHFCRMFENTGGEFSRSMFFELVNFEDDAE